MFCSKKPSKMIKSCQHRSKCGTIVFSALFGVAITTALFLIKDAKNKRCPLKKVFQKYCNCTENDNENSCDCNTSHDDSERARNDAICHGVDCNTEGLHSCGCLGYPHDEYEGFACSKGDRPNDLSNPEFDHQNKHADVNASPYTAKNASEKGNPQPKNPIKDNTEKK